MSRPDLYCHVLNQLKGGTAAAELSEALTQLCDDCTAANKAGEMTVTLKIKPQGVSGQYVFHIEHKAKPPKTGSEATLLFADADGNFSREDPRQQKLALRAAPDPAAGELRKVTPQ